MPETIIFSGDLLDNPHVTLPDGTKIEIHISPTRQEAKLAYITALIQDAQETLAGYYRAVQK